MMPRARFPVTRLLYLGAEKSTAVVSNAVPALTASAAWAGKQLAPAHPHPATPTGASPHVPLSLSPALPGAVLSSRPPNLRLPRSVGNVGVQTYFKTLLGPLPTWPCCCPARVTGNRSMKSRTGRAQTLLTQSSWKPGRVMSRAGSPQDAPEPVLCLLPALEPGCWAGSRGSQTGTLHLGLVLPEHQAAGTGRAPEVRGSGDKAEAPKEAPASTRGPAATIAPSPLPFALTFAAALAGGQLAVVGRLC